MFVNFLTIVLNGADKLISVLNFRIYRVPEKVLHLFTLAGGAPATAAAMLLFQHKSSKTPYQKTYLTMCYLHIFVFAAALVYSNISS